MKLRCVVTSLVMLISAPSFAYESQSFSQFINQLQLSLESDTVTKNQIEASFASVKRFKRSVNQAKVSVKQQVGAFGYLEQYLPKAVNEPTVAKARLFYKNNLALLDSIEKKYNVQPRFLVAQWGIVNGFSDEVGGYHALSVYASNGHKKQQSASLSEIGALVRLTAKGTMGDIELRSDWQGKLGLLNMLPSQIVDAHQDFNNDGKVDIWASKADGFATAAQHLADLGWNGAQTWGRQVRLPDDFDPNSLDDNRYRTLAQWSELGVIRFDQRSLPQVDLEAKIVAPDGAKGRVYLTYKNFEYLSQLNDSIYDTIAIAYLSNRIKFPAIK